MPNLRIYLKKGQSFVIEVGSIRRDDANEGFVILNVAQLEMGFIARRHVAAIVPADPRVLERRDIRVYTYYLKGHELQPITIDATACLANNPLLTEPVIDNRLVENVYIDPEEVITVTQHLRHV